VNKVSLAKVHALPPLWPYGPRRSIPVCFETILELREKRTRNLKMIYVIPALYSRRFDKALKACPRWAFPQYRSLMRCASDFRRVGFESLVEKYFNRTSQHAV